jgi:hypothetical protein
MNFALVWRGVGQLNKGVFWGKAGTNGMIGWR